MRSRVSPRAVSIIIGVLSPRSRIRRSAVKPSMRGARLGAKSHKPERACNGNARSKIAVGQHDDCLHGKR